MALSIPDRTAAYVEWEYATAADGGMLEAPEPVDDDFSARMPREYLRLHEDGRLCRDMTTVHIDSEKADAM